MDLRGKPEITVESRRLREPVRYQKGAYDGMHKRVVVLYTANRVVPQK